MTRLKRAPLDDEIEFGTSSTYYNISYSSTTYPTTSNELATNQPNADFVKKEKKKRKRRLLHSSKNLARNHPKSEMSSSKPLSECRNPHQCCCREKGVVDICWGYCVDIKEYSSRSLAVLGICEKWMSLINYCIYCYKHGNIKSCLLSNHLSQI